VKIPEIHVGCALPTKPLDKSKKICSGDAPQEEKGVATMNQDRRSKIHKFLTSFCLVLLALITLLTWSPSCAIANQDQPQNGEHKQSPCMVKRKESTEFKFKPEDPGFEEANEKFHESYERRILQESSKFGQPNGSTVLLISAEGLTLCHDGKKEYFESIKYDHNIYHLLKSIGHQPIDLYITVKPSVGKKITDPLFSNENQLHETITTEQYLENRKDVLKNVKNEVEKNLFLNKLKDIAPSLSEQELVQIKNEQKQIIEKSIDYIEEVIKEESIQSETLENYIRNVSPHIVEASTWAVTAQLDSLNKMMKNQLNLKNWKSPYVVIQGVHQARYRAVVTQYFEHVFDEPQGNAAEREDRIIFAEGISQDSENESLRLLASHIIDQEISLAFFHDPRRMQRDLLSDAATYWLWKHELDIPEWAKK